MKLQLKLEELTMLLFAILALVQLEYEWWWFLLLALGPDIGMLGYLINTKVGAFTYNLFHHKGLAVGLILWGYFYDPLLLITGLILFGHSSLDRVFGYGLKFNDHFEHTHLGWLKEAKS